MPQSFEVKDCALLAIATGRRAQNLRELISLTETIEPGCIYYHFWGGLLRPNFDNPEYPNDFAAWASNALNDKTLAERLAVIVPSNYESMEELRRELIDVMEERLDEVEHVPWTKTDSQFHFIHSQIVIFDTYRRIEAPAQLKKVIGQMSSSSIFYHFIDARRRTPHERDDFSLWLGGFDEDHSALIAELQGIDPYFSSLSEIQQQLVPIFERYL